MKLFRMKHRSLVRIIASIIPEFMWNFFLPVTPRMYISSSVMDKILSLKNNDVQSDDESFSSFKSHLSSNKDAAILYSTPLKYKSKDNSRLRELQRELDEIQKQLTKLMEHQCDQFHSSSYQMINGSTQQRTVWANITIQLAGSIDMVDYNLQIKSANPKYSISSPKHAV